SRFDKLDVVFLFFINFALITDTLISVNRPYVLLFDFSGSDNYLSLVDAVNWFKDYYDPVDTSLKHIRSAHLVGEQTEDFFQFVETAWLNRGGYVKVFRDEQSALEWLLGKL
ncbi:MAG: hypothetical protein N0C89_18130, partial [Candidatus Thiodiazotropha endolucinida]|nr:hypothetical protein [Candidatus Thiodiazotropha taylori]MCG8066037.1 hypothetical protein [Candidatus Thiodiazotropha taylori]MCW4332134.1 hypothetical protein [Candidatus Thiodiazotropha endolucinida]MCW4345375.1 hypothetical protein [Candidatus Thiodiazotropha endolucinida]